MKRKKKGKGEHPQVVANRDILEKFEARLKEVVKFDIPDTFKEATNFKARPTYFLQKLQACEKLSRDVLNEKGVAHSFAAEILVWEKYMKLVVYLKKHDMAKFKRTQDKSKSLVDMVDDVASNERMKQIIPMGCVREYNKIKIETSLNIEADIDSCLHAPRLLAKFPSLYYQEDDVKNKERLVLSARWPYCIADFRIPSTWAFTWVILKPRPAQH